MICIINFETIGMNLSLKFKNGTIKDALHSCFNTSDFASASRSFLVLEEPVTQHFQLSVYGAVSSWCIDLSEKGCKVKSPLE